MPNLLEVLRRNKDIREDVRLFEIGSVFVKGKEGVIEFDGLVVFVNVKQDKGQDSFLALKGISDSLFDSLGVTDDWVDDAIPLEKAKQWRYQLFHPFRRAEVKVGDTFVGLIGELNPRFSKAFSVKGRVSIFMAPMETLTRLATEEHEFQEFSRFPAVTRDIALLVPQEVRIEEVTNVIEQSGGEFLIDIDLFDIYEGPLRSRDSEASEHLDAEQKSLAFHLIFQSKDRTLTDTEVERFMMVIKKEVKDQKWEVR